MKRDKDVNAYGSDGRIYQLEYAMKAASLGTTTIGLRVKEGVVIVSEKKIVSSLQIPESVKKHHKISSHCGFAFSGLSGDARTIIKKARELSASHQFTYQEQVPIEGVLRHLSGIALNFGEKDENKKIFSRPFGICALICGYDTEPRLFSLDPSGTYAEYHAKAIGAGTETVKKHMEDSGLPDPEQPLSAAMHQGLKLLQEVMQNKLTPINCEAMICTQEGIRFVGIDELENGIRALEVGA